MYSSLRVIRMLKSRGMRWAGRLARIGKRRRRRTNIYFVDGKPEGKRKLGKTKT
jgi:hypothetical protein